MLNAKHHLRTTHFAVEGLVSQCFYDYALADDETVFKDEMSLAKPAQEPAV